MLIVVHYRKFSLAKRDTCAMHKYEFVISIIETGADPQPDISIGSSYTVILI